MEKDMYARFDLFYEMCYLLQNDVSGNEYYHTAEDIFNAIENKKIDVSHIVNKNEYEEFKQQVIKDKPFCPVIGQPPKAKYDTTTAEGRLAFLNDHPEEQYTF